MESHRIEGHPESLEFANAERHTGVAARTQAPGAGKELMDQEFFRRIRDQAMAEQWAARIEGPQPSSKQALKNSATCAMES